MFLIGLIGFDAIGWYGVAVGISTADGISDPKPKNSILLMVNIYVIHKSIYIYIYIVLPGEIGV